MEVEGVTDPGIGHGHDERRALRAEADVTEQAFVENAVDQSPVVGASFLLPAKSGAVRGVERVGEGTLGGFWHLPMMPDDTAWSDRGRRSRGCRTEVPSHRDPGAEGVEADPRFPVAYRRQSGRQVRHHSKTHAGVER